MGYAPITRAERLVSTGGETRTIRTAEVLGQLVSVMQTVNTEVASYNGLSEASAKILASPYDAQTNPQGLIRSNIGGVKVTVTDAIGASAWFSIFSCRGTVETANASRVGNSQLFNVTYTKQTLSVTADGGTITNI